jgi:hypothetical protein
MIDAVISLHMNPLTCGVAKWNHALAKRLGVPCLAIGSVEADLTFHPLVSVKPSEGDWPQGYKAFDLFLHGIPTIGTPLYRPTRIYAANREIADAIRHCRPDVIEAFCPGTVEGDPTRGVYQVLAFGMSGNTHATRSTSQRPFTRARHGMAHSRPPLMGCVKSSGTSCASWASWAMTRSRESSTTAMRWRRSFRQPCARIIRVHGPR